MSFKRSNAKHLVSDDAAQLDLVSRVAEAMRLITQIQPPADRGDAGSTQQAAELALAAAKEAERRLREQESRIAMLENLATSDPLTGLLNRRGFEDVLARTLAAARRYDETGVVLLIDLDGFKRVNDTYGHAAGDVVLRRVAWLLNRAVRRSDSVARLGGDEFAVLMARLPERDGRRRARALERQLNRLTLEYDGAIIPVRASLGVVPFNGTEDAVGLLKRADSAMYERKRAKADARSVGHAWSPFHLARTFPTLEVVASTNPFQRAHPGSRGGGRSAALGRRSGEARP